VIGVAGPCHAVCVEGVFTIAAAVLGSNGYE